MNERRVAAEILRLWEEPLPAAVFEERLEQARRELDGPELENLVALIEWFNRRYPTPLERLRYDRKKRSVTGGRSR